MRDRLLLLVKILVSAALLYFLFQKIGFQKVAQEIGSARLSWVLAAVVVFTLSNLLGAFQWFMLLKGAGVRLSYIEVLQYYYVGLFFNNLLISNMGGDVFRVYFASVGTKNASAAVSSVFLDRLFGFAMLTALAAFGGFYWFSVGKMHRLGGFLLLLLLLWAGVLLIFFYRPFGKLVRFILSWFMPEKLLRKLTDIYILIHDFSRNRNQVARVLAVSLLIQMARVLLHYFSGRAVGIRAEILSFMIFIPIIALLASLPISLGGLGVREQSGVLLFQRIGIPAASVIFMEFLAYLLSIFCSLPGIVFFVFINRRRKYHVEEM